MMLQSFIKDDVYLQKLVFFSISVQVMIDMAYLVEF